MVTRAGEIDEQVTRMFQAAPRLPDELQAMIAEQLPLTERVTFCGLAILAQKKEPVRFALPNCATLVEQTRQEKNVTSKYQPLLDIRRSFTALVDPVLCQKEPFDLQDSLDFLHQLFAAFPASIAPLVNDNLSHQEVFELFQTAVQSGHLTDLRTALHTLNMDPYQEQVAYNCIIQPFCEALKVELRTGNSCDVISQMFQNIVPDNVAAIFQEAAMHELSHAISARDPATVKNIFSHTQMQDRCLDFICKAKIIELFNESYREKIPLSRDAYFDPRAEAFRAMFKALGSWQDLDLRKPMHEHFHALVHLGHYIDMSTIQSSKDVLKNLKTAVSENELHLVKVLLLYGDFSKVRYVPHMYPRLEMDPEKEQIPPKVLAQLMKIAKEQGNEEILNELRPYGDSMNDGCTVS